MGLWQCTRYLSYPGPLDHLDIMDLLDLFNILDPPDFLDIQCL